jgi:hypothetical protein
MLRDERGQATRASVTTLGGNPVPVKLEEWLALKDRDQPHDVLKKHPRKATHG